VVVYGANAGTLKHAQFLKVQNINAKSGVICLDWLTYKKNILPVLLSKLAFLYYDIFITTTTTTTTFFFFFFFYSSSFSSLSFSVANFSWLLFHSGVDPVPLVIKGLHPIP